MAAGSAPPVPATAPSTVPVTGAEPVAASEPDPHGDPLDAFRGDADERAAGTPEGGWKLPLVLLGVGLIVALLLLTLALTGVIGRGNDTAEPAPAPSATAQATEAAPAEDPAPEPTPTAPPAVDDVTLVDPGQRYPDHPEHLDLATDGNENTAWRTLWYESPTYAGVKDGAGLVVALDEEAVLTAVGLDVRGEGGHAQLRTAPPGEAGSTVLAEGDIGPGSEIVLPEPAVLDEVVVWFDVLPRATENGRNMVALHELTVR